MAHGSALAYSVAVASSAGPYCCEARRSAFISACAVRSLDDAFIADEITVPSAATTMAANGWWPSSRERCASASTSVMNA